MNVWPQTAYLQGNSLKDVSAMASGEGYAKQLLQSLGKAVSGEFKLFLEAVILMVKNRDSYRTGFVSPPFKVYS